MAVRLYVKASDSILERLADVPEGTAKFMATKKPLYDLFRTIRPPLEMPDEINKVEPDFKPFFEKAGDDDWIYVLYCYIEEKYPAMDVFNNFVSSGFGKLTEGMMKLIFKWGLENGPDDIYAGGTKDKEQIRQLLHEAELKQSGACYACVLPIEEVLDQIEEAYWV